MRCVPSRAGSLRAKLPIDFSCGNRNNTVRTWRPLAHDYRVSISLRVKVTWFHHAEGNGGKSRTLGRIQRSVPVAGHRLFAEQWFSLTCRRARGDWMHRTPYCMFNGRAVGRMSTSIDSKGIRNSATIIDAWNHVSAPRTCQLRNRKMSTTIAGIKIPDSAIARAATQRGSKI
jgi:hypothetical protein